MKILLAIIITSGVPSANSIFWSGQHNESIIALLDENNSSKLSDVNLLNVIRYSSGQISVDSIYYKSTKTTSNNTCINDLIQGYYFLYKDQSYRISSFERIKKALNCSKANKEHDLYNLSLIAILDYYQLSFNQTNKDYVEYLSLLKENASSNIDSLWYITHEISFEFQKLKPSIISAEKILSLFENLIEENTPIFFRAHYYSNLGLFNELVQNNEHAYKHHKKAFELSLNEPFLRVVALRSLIRLSELEFKERNYKSGISYLDRADSLDYKKDTLEFNFYINFFKSKHLRKLKDSDRAYDMLNEAFNIQNKLALNQNSILTSELNIKLNTTEKEKQAQLDAINARLDGEQEERKRVANALHDDISSHLSAASIHLSLLHAENNTSATKAQELISEASQRTRQLSHELYPPILLNSGLVSAITAYAESASSNQTQLFVDTEGEKINLPQELEAKIYYIVIEFLQNILKHSGASQGVVSFEVQDELLSIKISDDGSGFDVNSTSDSLGISSARARIEDMGGKLIISSSAGQGSKVCFDVPIAVVS